MLQPIRNERRTQRSAHAYHSHFTSVFALSEKEERAAQRVRSVIEDAISVGLSAGVRQRSMQHVIVRAVIKKNKQITMGSRRF
jgi:hypothetical protein